MDFDWLSFSGMVALKIRFDGSKRSGIIKYEIDRVSDIRPAAAARAGEQGDRYTV